MTRALVVGEGVIAIHRLMSQTVRFVLGALYSLFDWQATSGKNKANAEPPTLPNLGL